jgi:flavin reductase (DIM6/NTAB) family NADH-FMN oxidoreductase RutF
MRSAQLLKTNIPLPDQPSDAPIGEDAVVEPNLSEGFRMAMRELAAGVSVVTTGLGKGRAGLTVTTACSLSMTPPSLIVSIQRSSRALKAILAFGAFGVNILTADQREIADRFSGRMGLRGDARFDGHDWTVGKSGVPILTSALSAIECSVEQVVDWHTHSVIFGRVSRVVTRGDRNALLYWRRDYMPSNGDPAG